MKSKWEEKNGFLERLFVFSDFQETLNFVNKVGDIAEEYNHHPTITLQNYKEVVVQTTTHDAGDAVTEKDILLTKAIDGIE